MKLILEIIYRKLRKVYQRERGFTYMHVLRAKNTFDRLHFEGYLSGRAGRRGLFQTNAGLLQMNKQLAVTFLFCEND